MGDSTGQGPATKKAKTLLSVAGISYKKGTKKMTPSMVRHEIIHRNERLNDPRMTETSSKLVFPRKMSQSATQKYPENST